MRPLDIDNDPLSSFALQSMPSGQSTVRMFISSVPFLHPPPQVHICIVLIKLLINLLVNITACYFHSPSLSTTLLHHILPLLFTFKQKILTNTSPVVYKRNLNSVPTDPSPSHPHHQFESSTEMLIDYVQLSNWIKQFSED